MSVIARRPLLRWAVPGAALVVALGGGAAVNALHASADETLPSRTPAQLLVDIEQARLDAASGTVVATADLGLPELPTPPGGAGSATADLTGLLSGSHTLRVWYAGQDKARVALLDRVGESDVIRNGQDLWLWSSADNSAEHSTLAAPGTSQPRTLPSGVPTDPQAAADQVLAALDPTTAVSTSDTLTVAGRAAYDLVLKPKDATSLIGSVSIAIDGERHIPLQVQVYPRGTDSPAFQIGFTQVSFAKPDEDVFAFTPPKGVKVTEHGSTDQAGPGAPGATAPQSAVIGKGWTAVLVTRVGTLSTGGSQKGPETMQSYLGALPRVSGSWGSGRLLTGTLFSALLTDDGRLLAGAVSPQALLAAAADPAAALK